jgi:hypothetical protein
MGDPEIDAMGKVLSALSPLDESARVRVISWATEKLGLPKVAPASHSGAGGKSAVAARAAQDSNTAFRDLADLFDAANPETDVDKALVAGYWVQVCEGNSDFVSQQINDHLKQLGHPIGNITRALSGLIGGKPALALQLRKEGGTQQARKIYRLTAAGIRRVESMTKSIERQD